MATYERGKGRTLSKDEFDAIWTENMSAIGLHGASSQRIADHLGYSKSHIQNIRNGTAQPDVAFMAEMNKAVLAAKEDDEVFTDDGSVSKNGDYFENTVNAIRQNGWDSIPGMEGEKYPVFLKRYEELLDDKKGRRIAVMSSRKLGNKPPSPLKNT